MSLKGWRQFDHTGRVWVPFFSRSLSKLEGLAEQIGKLGLFYIFVLFIYKIIFIIRLF